jgi:hypothetical protein
MSVASFLGFGSTGVFWYALLPITSATRFSARVGAAATHISITAQAIAATRRMVSPRAEILRTRILA